MQIEVKVESIKAFKSVDMTEERKSCRPRTMFQLRKDVDGDKIIEYMIRSRSTHDTASKYSRYGFEIHWFVREYDECCPRFQECEHVRVCEE